MQPLSEGMGASAPTERLAEQPLSGGMGPQSAGRQPLPGTTGAESSFPKKRLASLDILRGMDLFLLTVLGPFMLLLAATGDFPWLAPVTKQLEHVTWEGFRLWDLIMPLFMFLSGVTIPFSLGKYMGGPRKFGPVYGRILKRCLLLWLLGMVVQGQLLDLDVKTFRYFSNTLQSIAVGYLFSCIFFLHVPWKGQAGIAAGLLAAYWAAMMFLSVDGFGGGDFTPRNNLCEYIDRIVLGSHRDMAATAPDGTAVFYPGYTYTWILSSLNFIVTVMTGMFAGEILRSGRSEKAKMKTLLFIGLAMTAGGWLWHLQMPVIKRIWTSSMVLVASGYSFLLLAGIYYIVDYKGWGRGLEWLKVFGMNSIVAYLMAEIVHLESLPNFLLRGLHRFVSPEWFAFFTGICCIGLNWAVLALLYRRKKFIRL